MGQHGSGNGGSGHRRATVHHGRTTRIRARSHGAGYAVQHYKQHGNGSAIPAGAWVYVRPISGGGGYKIHLDSAGHAGQLQALSGSEHPTELQVAAGTHYAAVWSQAELAQAALDTALGQAANRVTPSASDASAHQLLVPGTAASDYAVQHYKQHGSGSAIPAGSWVYLRPASGGGGYSVHLDTAGHAGQVQALGGSEHPTELRVAAGTHYAAVWSQTELAHAALETALSEAANRVTPSAADAGAHQILVLGSTTGYAVVHYQQHGSGHDIPAAAWVYLRPVSGSGGYKIQLNGAGHAGTIQALSGSEHPTELRVSAGTQYASTWSTLDLTPAQLDAALGQSANRITPSAEDARAQRIRVPSGPDYAVLHFKQQTGGHDIPNDSRIYLRPASASSGGYRIHVGSGGSATRIDALAGGEHPTELRVVAGVQYAAFWGGTLEAAAIETGLRDAAHRLTPTEADSTAHQIQVPVGPLTYTTETAVTQPADRARRTVGVGEHVHINLYGGGGPDRERWTVTGGGADAHSLNTNTGPVVEFTAPATPGTVTINVTKGSQTAAPLVFTVIAPNETKIRQRAFTPGAADADEHHVGWPDSGFHGEVYLLPDTVNFYRVEFLELEVTSTVSAGGVFGAQGHHPASSPIACTQSVLAGHGTRVGGANTLDHIYSGVLGGMHEPYTPSESTYQIPHHYKVVGSRQAMALFYTCRQHHQVEGSLSRNRPLHSEKGGARVDLHVDDPTLP